MAAPLFRGSAIAVRTDWKGAQFIIRTAPDHVARASPVPPSVRRISAEQAPKSGDTRRRRAAGLTAASRALFVQRARLENR